MSGLTPGKFEKAFQDALGGHIDLKSFTREFLTLQGGMAGLARLLFEQIDAAPDGSMAKAQLLRMAVGLIEKAHEGSASERAMSLIAPEDFDAAFLELAGSQVAADAIASVLKGGTVGE
jgi:hypothetical protein